MSFRGSLKLSHGPLKEVGYEKTNDISKLVCLIALLAAAIAFFLPGALTDIYKLMFAVGVRGSELFKQMQPFNRQLVIRCIAMILLAVCLRHQNAQEKVLHLQLCGDWGNGHFERPLLKPSIARILEYKRRFLTEVDFEAWFVTGEHTRFPLY